MGEDERSFHTKVSIKVLGYLIGDGPNNENRPKVIKKESIVEIKLPRERVILEDEIPWKKKRKKRMAQFDPRKFLGAGARRKFVAKAKGSF